jgi:hypothetical protein
VRAYSVTAVTAPQIFPSGKLVYYRRAKGATDAGVQYDEATDSAGMLYVLSEDLEEQGGKLRLKLKPGQKLEPLVLRANAGECIQVTLNNKIPPSFNSTLQSLGANVGAVLLNPSNAGPGVLDPYPSLEVGLHPQLVAHDITSSSGFNAGVNPVQTVAPGGMMPVYQWYAGSLELGKDGKLVGKPMELGAINLIAADPLGQPEHGMIGALVIEPAGSTWKEDPGSRASATVTPGGGGQPFREFVMMVQENLFLDQASIFTAFNYGTEHIPNRYNGNSAVTDLSCAFSNRLQYLPDPVGDPQSVVFTAPAGMPARFRVLHSGTAGDGVVTLAGHSWQDEPYVDGSSRIGDNPTSNSTTSRTTFGTGGHFDLVIPSAGGTNAVPGDYLIKDFPPQYFTSGTWGVLRVTPAGSDTVTITSQTELGKPGVVKGNVTVGPSGQFAASVALFAGPPSGSRCSGMVLGTAPIDPVSGQWAFKGTGAQCAQSSGGGVAGWAPTQPSCVPPKAAAPPSLVRRAAPQAPAAPGVLDRPRFQPRPPRELVNEQRALKRQQATQKP